MNERMIVASGSDIVEASTAHPMCLLSHYLTPLSLIAPPSNASGPSHVLASAFFSLPVIRSIVAGKERQTVRELEESMAKKADPDAIRELPPKGLPADELRRLLKKKARWFGGCGC